ncbi:MAG: membrane protein insertion efficiency factor YidD [Burkholderiales bacterium]|nr:membrane protein insertion efficiency factor YidD [Burkholderiales bacterium]
MRWLLLRLIDAYRLLLSPFFGQQCRFHPTCSQYASEAIETHGVLRGAGLAARRILRCGPWHPGGVDPVPPSLIARRGRRVPSGSRPRES